MKGTSGYRVMWLKNLKYILFSLVLFFSLKFNVLGADSIGYRCNYVSDDGDTSLSLAISNTYGSQIGWKITPSSIAARYKGKGIEEKEIVFQNDSSNNENYFGKFINESFMCPEYAKIKKNDLIGSIFGNDYALWLGSSSYIESISSGIKLSLSNSFQENLSNYSSYENTSKKICNYNFYVYPDNYNENMLITPRLASVPIGEMFINDSRFNSTCPTNVYMLCKKGDRSVCYYSYSKTKPLSCSSSDTDCYYLPNDFNSDGTVVEKEENIKNYKVTYKEALNSDALGKKFRFSLEYDVANNYSRGFEISFSKDGKKAAVVSTKDVLGFSQDVFDPIVNNKKYPEEWYCAANDYKLAFKGTVNYMVGNDKSEIVCSNDSGVFLNEYHTYKLESINTDDEDDEPEVKTDLVCGIFPKGGSTIKRIRSLYNLIKLFIPLLVIIVGITNFAKVVFSGDDKSLKDAGNKFVKSIMAGVIFILLPVLVDFVIGLAGLDSSCIGQLLG